jgi:hypothetical protein
MLESVQYAAGSPSDVSEDKKRIVKNLYLSNIAEEFVAMQVDLEIPVVISILKELDVYRGQIADEDINTGNFGNCIHIQELPLYQRYHSNLDTFILTTKKLSFALT